MDGPFSYLPHSASYLDPVSNYVLIERGTVYSFTFVTFEGFYHGSEKISDSSSPKINISMIPSSTSTDLFLTKQQGYLS
jgi:hypothetical protein